MGPFFHLLMFCPLWMWIGFQDPYKSSSRSRCDIPSSDPFGRKNFPDVLTVEPSQGKGDDTALNAIRLYCAEPAKKDVKATITSSKGEWGVWTEVQWCPYGNFVSFSLKVEPAIDGDDTAVNNIMLQCSDMKILRGHGGIWGDYGDWSEICYGGVCGMKTRVEAPQHDGDDTALNDVELLCCQHN